MEGILTRGCQELIKKGYKVEEIVQQLCKKAEVDFGYFKDDDFEPLPQVKLPHRLMRGRDSKQDADGYISTEGQKGDIPELLLKSGDDTARLHL